MSYTLGLHEIADGTHAYLQPDGGWGWSNAGLVVGDGASLLVDTLFDLKITQRMLDAMAPHTRSAAISTVVNTHANGDHCYGNQLVRSAEIIASEATAHEMSEVPPSMLAALNKAPGEVGTCSDTSLVSLSLMALNRCCPRAHSRGDSNVRWADEPLNLSR